MTRLSLRVCQFRTFAFSRKRLSQKRLRPLNEGSKPGPLNWGLVRPSEKVMILLD